MQTFESLKQAEEFKENNQWMLLTLQSEAESVAGVVCSEVWLNGNCPSFVVGIDCEDQHIVSFKI